MGAFKLSGTALATFIAAIAEFLKSIEAVVIPGTKVTAVACLDEVLRDTLTAAGPLPEGGYYHDLSDVVVVVDEQRLVVVQHFFGRLLERARDRPDNPELLADHEAIVTELSAVVLL